MDAAEQEFLPQEKKMRQLRFASYNAPPDYEAFHQELVQYANKIAAYYPSLNVALAALQNTQQEMQKLSAEISSSTAIEKRDCLQFRVHALQKHIATLEKELLPQNHAQSVTASQ